MMIASLRRPVIAAALRGGYRFGHGVSLGDGVDASVKLTPPNMVRTAGGQTVTLDGAHGDSRVRTTRLDNGTKVVSKDLGGAAARLTFLFLDGPQHEDLFTAGSSQFMKYALSKDGVTSSEFVTKTMLGKAGIVLEAPQIVGRNYIGFSCAGNRDTIAQAAVCDKFWQSLLFPRFTAEDVSEARRLVHLESAELKQDNPTEWLKDAVHKTAFKGSPLGHSLFCPSYNVNAVSSESLFDRWEANYGFGNIAIVATNVDHHELLDALVDTPWIGRAHAKAGERATPPSVYVGGESYDVHNRNVDYDDQFTSVNDTFTALAFKAPGMNTFPKWAAAAIVSSALNSATNAVLKSSFSADKVEVFYNAYADVGLLGLITPAATTAQLQQFKDAIANMANLSAADLKQQQDLCSLSILSKADSGKGTQEMLLASMAATGNPVDAEMAVAAVRAVTSADLKAVVSEMLAGQPTLVNYGNSQSAPELASLN